MLYPTTGNIISHFGASRDGGARSHEGIDIGAPQGTPIVAAIAGRVTAAGWLGSNPGNGVKIDHSSGYLTKYFHLSSISVHTGQQVNAGQVIGTVGKTGNAQTTPPHLHFELWINGRAVNPVSYFGAQSPAPAPSFPVVVSSALPSLSGFFSSPNAPLILGGLLFFIVLLRR